ncbi:hypothetical protein GD3902_17405 [Geobacillus thermodenitrificans]|nr:hypothetical protein GD3902_00100 [Geobacillus thermodenitrificans]ARA99646.1 hypothetical protein GD3902_17405 [Geobacillus thermodenitrificans]
MPASSFRVVSGIESFIFATQFGHRPLLESLMVVNKAGLHELLNVKLFLPLYGASHPFSHSIPSVFLPLLYHRLLQCTANVLSSFTRNLKNMLILFTKDNESYSFFI